MSQQQPTRPDDDPARSAISRPELLPRRLLTKRVRGMTHPTVFAEAEHRASSVQLRVADAITAFAGSMNFAG